MTSTHTDVVQLFERITAPAAAASVFLETATQRVTYGQLAERTQKVATLLTQRGIREGDRVVMSVADEVEMALLFLALLGNGVTTVLLDPDAKVSRAEAIIETAQPVGIIADAAFFESIPSARTVAFSLVVEPEQPKKGQLFRKLLGKSASAPAANTYPALVSGLPPGTLPTAVNPETVAYILFTSGTTSDPKGVQITYRSLFSHLRTLSTVYGLSAKSRLLNNLLLYHVDGIVQGPVLAAYQTAVWIRPFTFEINRIGALLDAVYKYRVTHFVAVPTMLTLIQRFADGYEDSFRTPDFQFIISVSAHLEENLWRTFSERFGVRIVNVYGLTETVTGGLFSGPDDDTYQPGTVGKPVDVEARIIDSAGREVPAGEAGELLLRGESIMKGYLQNEAATSAVLRDGWLHTGDIAVRDAAGFFRITGRLKNLIISGGVNIHPEEITEILNTHPDVLESVSYGMDDAVFGERLVSCVVLKPGGTANELSLTAFCREQLEERKVPTAIYQLDRLPKGLSGKVQLAAVREQVSRLAGQLVEEGPDYHALIMETASKAFKVPVSELRPEDGSRSVAGWDSMAHLDFIIQLEKALGVEFDTADIMVMNNLQTAEDVARKKTQSR